ncbi:unnamed protein product [Porites evermanni]|uniref:DZIP3-like HEPN domain-containing protein n=1 Tax=Porites evermanni TaxID=104178 RepID=A0ABN8LB13_9CNID|nr:unnamed protein product [Porites evermanni]
MACVTPTTPSTKETTNYARLCRLLVELGTRALKDTFDSIHRPATLHAVLAGNKTLFPTNSFSVSSSSFDITLLMVLLRNICGLVAPATGWDALPTATDSSREANIVRIKFFRNTLYAHARHASVDDTTFNSQWRDIRKSLVCLGGLQYRTAIDHLETECMDPESKQHCIELLEQWKKDEDNVKDQLEEVMKKLDKITTESKLTLKSLKSPDKIRRGSNTYQDHENEPVEYFSEDCKVCEKCGQFSSERQNEMAKVVDKLKAKAVYVEAKVNEQTDLMQKSQEKICFAEKDMVEIVEEKIRLLNAHKRDMKMKFSEIREAQQREHETRIRNFKMVAIQTRKYIEKGEDFLKRMNGPGILETECADDLIRFEEGLNDEEMEIYKPRRVTYRADKDSVTQGTVELEPHCTAALVQRTGAFRIAGGRSSHYSNCSRQDRQHTPNTACATHDVVVNRCEKPLTAWPRGLQMSPHQNKGLRSFKSRGKGQGVFHNPCSIAMNQKTGYIVVAGASVIVFSCLILNGNF